MENYKCYECSQTFKEIKLILSHLKCVHFVKENLTQIHCVNNFTSYKCSKSFLTFSGLRNHLNKCSSTGKEFDAMVNSKLLAIMKHEKKIQMKNSLMFFYRIIATTQHAMSTNQV